MLLRLMPPMRGLIAGLVVATITPILAAQQAGSPAHTQASPTTVRGVVVRADSRRPVPDVEVSINMPGGRPTTTDSGGRFVFERVPPGRYNVFSNPNGFVVGADGALARIIVTAAPTPVDVELVLTPFGSISGTVRDPEGRPLVSVPVDLKMLVARNGRRVMIPVGANRSRTDDRGMYRVPEVSPGEYYVRADVSSFARSQTREGWQRTFYPTAIEPAAASRVIVTAGADVTDRNITIQPVPTYTVSGVVDNQLPAAQRRPATDPLGHVSSFWVVRAGATVDDDPVLLENVLSPQRTPDGTVEPDERFELRGLAAGTYDLYPIVMGTLAERDQAYGMFAYTGRTRITIVDRNITGVRAIARRGPDVRLREVSRARAVAPVPPQGSLAARMLSQQRVSLSPRESIPVLASREGGLGVGPDPSGIFTVPNVTTGRYDVELDFRYPYPDGEYLADIRQDGRSILETGLSITDQAPALIDLVFEPGGGVIAGAVRNSNGQPTFERQVVLLPRISGRRRALDYRSTTADGTGAYRFTNITPGDYLVFAPTTSRDWANESDADVRTIATRARPVTVRRGATLTVQADVLDVRALLAATASLPLSATPPAAVTASNTQAAPRTSEQGTIRGTVLLEDSTEPVQDLEVTLSFRAGDSLTVERRSTRTDRDGQFHFDNVQAGSYGVRADVDGYLPTTRSRTSVTVTNTGTTAPVLLTVVRGGLITGHLLDAAGRPVRGARVVALKPQFTNGEGDFARVVDAVQTNDLGEFRIFWLYPASYYLAAAPPATLGGLVQAMHPKTGAATFYPGVRDPAEARRVIVGGGETRADFTLMAADAHLIAGEITATRTSDRIDLSNFYLMPRGVGAKHVAAYGSLFGHPPFDVHQSGTAFTLTNVPSSAYDLYVIGPDNVSARIPLTVDGRDVIGIVASLAPNPVLTLRVTVDNTTATIAPRLRALDALPAVVGASPTGEARGNGVFTFMALEGRYLLDVHDYSTGAYVADILDGSTSILAQGIIASRPALGPLNVAVKTDGGTIVGTVMSTNGGITGRTVALVPAMELRHVGALYRSAETESGGTFRLTAIAPGQYSLFVLTDTDWANDQLSGVAEQHDGDARQVTVGPRSYQEIQLQLPQ